MYLISLSAGIILIAMAVFLLSFGRQVYIGLFTGEARETGTFITSLAITILIGCLVGTLLYIGYHGIIGKLTIDLLK